MVARALRQGMTTETRTRSLGAGTETRMEGSALDALAGPEHISWR